MNFVFLMDSSSFIGIALVLLFILDLLPYFTCMNVLLVFINECFACVCICASRACWVHSGVRRAWLELQMVVSQQSVPGTEPRFFSEAASALYC